MDTLIVIDPPHEWASDWRGLPVQCQPVVDSITGARNGWLVWAQGYALAFGRCEPGWCEVEWRWSVDEAEPVL
jgi:hypothetical protein